ncbi:MULTISPECIES: hypothetical protein [Streptomyces]|uniref:Uncharacterized protein n=2 Tax=Streptomyces TaxID=1883 RepID=A0ABV9IX08_9ACTN
MTETLRDRWAWVLDAMAESGAITARQRAEARFPAFRFYPPGTTEGQRQYMIDVAAKEAADRLGIPEDELARGGYTVRTTFDLALQDSTTERLKDLKGRKGTRLHTAVVAIEPGDGALRLLYGAARTTTPGSRATTRWTGRWRRARHWIPSAGCRWATR